MKLGMEPSGSSFKGQSKKNNKKGENKKKGDGEASQLRPRAQNWSVEQTTLMLSLVREEQVNQRVTGPGGTFTKQFWNRLAPLLNSQSAPHRHANELQVRWKTLKADFYEYKNCVDKTGWGWDPEKRVPVAPDESCWDDLRKHNAKLYKCKSKAFIWYDEMNELCGSNIATGHFSMCENLFDHISRSDSSDTNRSAEQELNEVDIHAFKTRLEVDSNYLVGNSVGGLAMEQLLEDVSGDASGTNSGKRVRDESVGAGCSESSKVKISKRVSKNKQFNTGVDKLVEESKERRGLIEVVSNKGKRIAEKLLKIKRETNMTSQDFISLQAVLNKDELSKELFMMMEGDELTEWIKDVIAYYRQG